MSQSIDQVTSLLKTRLSEIDKERTQLERALKALEGDRPQRARTRATGPSRRRRQRAPRGQRQAQFIEQVKKAPGSRVGEIAKAIGVPAQQLYAVARRLEQEGKVVKRDRGYAVAKAAKS